VPATARAAHAGPAPHLPAALGPRSPAASGRRWARGAPQRPGGARHAPQRNRM